MTSGGLLETIRKSRRWSRNKFPRWQTLLHFLWRSCRFALLAASRVLSSLAKPSAI